MFVCVHAYLALRENVKISGPVAPREGTTYIHTYQRSTCTTRRSFLLQTESYGSYASPHEATADNDACIAVQESEATLSAAGACQKPSHKQAARATSYLTLHLPKVAGTDDIEVVLPSAHGRLGTSALASRPRGPASIISDGLARG